MAALVAPVLTATITQSLTALGAVLSPSQVRTLMDCSARWYYKYALSIPEPKNAKLALGIAVHDAIAFHFTGKIEEGEDPPLGDALAHYAQVWEAVAVETEFHDDESPAELEAQGRALVEKYIREAAPRIEPAAVELEIAGEIAGVWIVGKIDVLEQSGRIRDIKTSSAKSSSITNEQRFQLATYVQCVSQASGEIAVDQLVKTKTPQLVQLQRTLTARDLEATEQLYPLAQAVMRSELYMPNRTSALCSRRNCAYWRKCQSDFGGDIV